MQQKYPHTVCITGASSGIGFETAKALAGRGALVIGIGRSSERCEEAARRIRSSLQSSTSVQGAIHFVHADLSSLAEVRTAASAVSAVIAEHGYQYLDVLINNAAAVPSRRTVTEDGYELQWAVNHLAPFLLTHQLLPLLMKSDDARILTVSSRSHRIGRIRLKDLNLTLGYSLMKAYSQSKLANVLFTYHFNRHLSAQTGVRAFVVDPGLVRTEIGHKHTRGLSHWIWSLRQRAGVSPEDGAATSVYLATAPQSNLNAGEYWRDCRPVPSSKRSYDRKLAEEMWRISESMCAISYTRYESEAAGRQKELERATGPEKPDGSGDFIIRPARSKEDIGEIKTLFREYAEELDADLSFQAFRDEIQSLPGVYAPPEGSLFLARVNGEAAGCIALRRIDEDACEMKRLYIRPRFRKLGLGYRLVETLLTSAKDKGYRLMRLDTLERLDAALHLYRKMGFYEIPAYTYNPLEGAVYMERKL